MELILASMNQHKCDEVSKILEGIEVLPISRFCNHFDVVEDGTTYEENALIKARAAYQITKKACIADDSGINVVALDNGPGIYSARYLGEKTDYKIKNQSIIDICKEKNEYQASFTCVIAYIDQDGKEYVFRYDLLGKIAASIQGEQGFGYDPIFIPHRFEKTMAQLYSKEKNMISHRYQALQKLLRFLKNENQIHIVLYQPEIPQNTGNIMRTCAATNAVLHLIKPLGFKLDEARMRRSGMDYIDHMKYYVYENWEDFISKNPSSNYYFLTRYGTKAPSEFQYPIHEDLYFVLGSESSGIDKKILKDHLDTCMRLPMQKDARSLNLSNCAAIIAYEALRQWNYRNLSCEEVIKGKDFLKELNYEE